MKFKKEKDGRKVEFQIGNSEKAKIIGTVEDSEIKTTWYSCGCNKLFDKHDKTTHWQINPKFNKSGKCKFHKHSTL